MKSWTTLKLNVTQMTHSEDHGRNGETVRLPTKRLLNGTGTIEAGKLITRQRKVTSFYRLDL